MGGQINMRVLVTGAAGMLGSSLIPALEREGYKVYPTDINITDKGIEYLDVRYFDEVNVCMKKLKPEIVMHLAAETDVDLCEAEPEHAYFTNTVGTENVAWVCKENGRKMVYISTAGVFDGKKNGKYTELDPAYPINVYGKTKLEGEEIVKRLLTKYFIVRAGWMVGGGYKDKKFVAKILKQIKEGNKKIYAVNDKWGTPTYTPAFSSNLLRLIQTDYYGLYHMACTGIGTRYDVAKKILEILGRKDIELIQVDSGFFIKDYPAPRPRSEMMENYVLEKNNLNFMPNWEDALREYIV